MGVRHLTAFLRPFVESESLEGQAVVIDGPAFAHHLHHLCVRGRSQARNAFEAVPTYLELGKAAIAWLDQLKKSNVLVKRIYFDGYLPPAKLDTRLERLYKSVGQLSAYYKAKSGSFQASVPQTDQSAWLFYTRAIPARLTSIPSLPFLVPAIIEALLNSEHAQVTVIVPDEADVYCADYVGQLGGIVLTSDSDLLVSDIGVDGKVCFFNDVELSSGLSTEQIRGSIYHPATLARRLDLAKDHGLRALAFEIIMDPSGSFGKLHKQAKDLDAVRSYPEEYSTFSKTYPSITQGLHGAKEVSRLPFSRLDPRVSEYILQFPMFAQAAGLAPRLYRLGQPPFHVFLPCLLESPIHTTGWEASSTTRQLGYGLVNLVVPSNRRCESLIEHRKQIAKMGGREVQIPFTIEAIQDSCSSIVEIYNSLRVCLPHLSDTQLWTAITIVQDLQWSVARQKSALAGRAVKKFSVAREKEKSPMTYDWELIQFFSQVQASLYSLRILQQIATVVICYKGTKELPGSLPVLLQQLDSLPKFHEYQDRGTFDLFQDELPAMIIAANAVLGVEKTSSTEARRKGEDGQLGSSKPSGPAGRVKQKRSHAPSPLPKRQKSSNPFDLLDLE